MRITASKIRYQGTRSEQQDTVNVLTLPGKEDAGVLGVLTDGIGGLERGGDVGALVNETVSIAALDHCRGRDRPDIRIDDLQAFAEAADQSLAAFKSAQDISSCGSTLLILSLTEFSCHYLSIGDSIIYAQDHAGQLTRINLEHAERVGGRLVLTSAVMGETIPKIDRGEISILNGDVARILLSSDGLRSLPESEIAHLLNAQSETKLRNVVDAVADLRRENQDNLSMILFELE